MNSTTNKAITKTDLHRIEASIEKLVKETKGAAAPKEYLDLLNQMADTVHRLQIAVEFDHEKRIQAIEDFLQQI